MEIEVKNQQLEKIEISGNVHEIFGIKSAHSFRGYMDARIKHFIRFPSAKYSGKEIEMMFRSILGIYEKFHPDTIAKIPIESFKGYSGINIQEFPTYFQTTQHRKTEKGIKEIRHKIPKYQLKYVQNAIEGVELNKKVHTRYIAQEYVKNANIELDNKKRPYFDITGFNFEQFVGNRSHYTPFNICLKILQHYKYIKYYKNGEVERIKDELEFDLNIT